MRWINLRAAFARSGPGSGPGQCVFSFPGFRYALCVAVSLLLATATTASSGEHSPELHNNLNMRFVHIPAGQFMMGSPESEPGRSDDESRREVTLTRAFYLQTTPVTRGQWLALVDGHPGYFQDCGDDCPVDGLKPEWVFYYIDRLNAQGDGLCYRLPTEAEWEYAARAGTDTAFYTGDCVGQGQGNVSGHEPVGRCPLFGRSRGPTPVAQYAPNPWGLYDMLGQTWELVADWYGAYAPGPVTDPTGPERGDYRVLRGGSWHFLTRHARSASRFRAIHDIAGFRLVAEPAGVIGREGGGSIPGEAGGSGRPCRTYR